MLKLIKRFVIQPVFLKSDSLSTIHKSLLPNSVKLVSESKRFPSSVSLGIVVQLGIRNDPKGYLDLYKDLFLRSRSSIDQKAYSSLELAGCDINLNLSQESIYFHTTCLEEHLDIVIPSLKQAIFSNKLQMDSLDGLNRLKVYQEDPEKIEEKIKHMILTSAYQGKTLGIRHPKIQKHEFTHSEYCDFIDQHFTAEKISVAACGVEDHSGFEKIVNDSFGSLSVGKAKNEKSEYVGGVIRETITEGFMSYYTLGFKGAGFHMKDMPALAVLKAIIGDGGGFSTGGPGKGMHSRAYTKILPHGFLESVKTQNFCFTDSGVFSISLVGLDKYSEYLPFVIVKELSELIKIQQEELDRAKNIITRESLINYQKTTSWVEEIAKHCANFFQTPEEFGYLKKINDVSLDDIKQTVFRLLRSEFSVWTAVKQDVVLPDLAVLYKKLGR